jgi:hypothetical protein
MTEAPTKTAPNEVPVEWLLRRAARRAALLSFARQFPQLQVEVRLPAAAASPSSPQ